MARRSKPQTDKPDHYAQYLRAIRGRALENEIALYTPLSRHLLDGVLHYDPSKGFSINRQQEKGRPDLVIYSPADKSPWIVGEIKLDDEEIRNDRRRKALWKEKIVQREYALPSTFYVLLIAPHTFYVCDLDGQILDGFHILLEEDMVGKRGDLLDFRGQTHPGNDEGVRELLWRITRETAEQGPQYEAFREGKLKSGRIPLDLESLPILEEVVLRATRDLTGHCRAAFHRLRGEHETAHREIANLEAHLEKVRQMGDLIRPDQLRREESRVLRRKRKALPLCQIFDYDYHLFERDQAFASEKAQQHVEDLFLSNTAYVALCRLVFVRICEDAGLTTKKISNSGIAVWRKLVSAIKSRYQSLLRLAFEDVSYIYSRLFEEEVFDWFGQTDSEIHQVIERILFELNAFDFQNVGRDLLGMMYQTLRPRAERKRLGEYYTDHEVVDFVLRRVGILDDPDLMQKRVLDPSCGSFTFGIRVLSHALDNAETHSLSPPNTMELGRRLMSGWDINPFATFLSHLSTLFLFLNQYIEAQRADRDYTFPGFSVFHVNSLAVRAETAAEGGKGSAEQKAEEDLGEGFDYVVGNPPFVRNERVPEGDREFLEREFVEVRERNTDLSAFFIYSAFKRWLKPGGRFGMVAPIGLLNASMAAPLRKFLADRQIDEIVSLEWMATEIFEGTDIIPILIFGTNQAVPKGHKISLVSGLRSVQDLIECSKNHGRLRPHITRIPYKKFLDLSPTGDWPVEVTGDDVPILEHLRKRPTLAEILRCSYAATAGAGDRVLVEAAPGAGKVPWLRGQHICQFAADCPREYVSIKQVVKDARDPSVWRFVSFYEHNAGKQSDDGMGRSDLEIPPRKGTEYQKEFRVPSDARIGVFVKIHPTLNACAIDPLKACAQDSCLVIVPYRYTAHLASAIVNSRISRYYAFLLSRAAILLRRRATWYPRTIEGLPLPDLDKRAANRLHKLALSAEQLSLEQPPSALDLYARASARLSRDKAGFLGVRCEGAGRIDLTELERAQVEADRLQLGPIAIAAPSPDLLVLLRTALLTEANDEIAVEDVQNVLLPRDAGERRKLAAAVSEFEARLKTTEAAMHEIEEEIDEIVAAGLGLTPKMHETIKKRCGEFPLSVTVGAPRYIWSADRKVQAQRLYKEGERYSAQ